MGIVRRIVQHLNLKQLARVFYLADAVDEPFDDVTLVIERKLDGDPGKAFKTARCVHDDTPAVLAVFADHFKTVAAIAGQHDQNCKVRDKDHPVKQLQVMNIAEGIVEDRVHQLAGGGIGGESQYLGAHGLSSDCFGKLDCIIKQNGPRTSLL